LSFFSLELIFALVQGEATAAFEGSAFAKQMLGDDVHHHYLHFFKTEELAYLQAVTDWEKARYFEQI
jgi:glutamine synthetase